MDLIQPSERLIEEGLDYVMLETIGSVATCRAAKRAHGGGPGYHPYLGDRLRPLVAPAAEHGTTIVTNGGVVDPIEAARLADEIVREQDLSVQVIAVTGDGCLDLAREEADDHGIDPDGIISANAYIGTEELVGALELVDDDHDAAIVIGGRLADPSLVVAPLAHEFGWKLDDWDTLGQATILGHLLECSAQVAGGFFADPPRKVVPDLPFIGYPYAEVEADGTGVITKPDGTGGRIDRHTVREQLFYEVHDPSTYVTPDVTADFTTVELTEVGEDRVEVGGGTGRERPEDLKVLVGRMMGFEFEKFIPFGGPNAIARAAVSEEIVEKRLEHVYDVDRSKVDLRLERFGVDALYGDAYDGDRSGYAADVAEHEEILLRVAASAPERELLEPALRVVSDTLVGPAGSGIPMPYGSGAITERAEIEPIYVPRERITGNVAYTPIETSGGRP